MKNIVLDTNIIYQEGLTSGRMKVLEKLVADQLIVIHVPEIVKREFITKRVSEITEAFTSIQSNLKTILRKVGSVGSFKDQSVSLEAAVLVLIPDVEKHVAEEFNKWVEQLAVKVLDFNPVQIENVLDDYFVGRGAFKSQKNREDFPDSMIHHSICNLVGEVGELYVVLSDGAFKRGIKEDENITTLNSLNELFKLEDIDQHLSNELLNEYFVGASFSESLRNYLSEEKDLIEYIYIPDCIVNTELIGINLYAAELNFPNSKDITELTITDFYPISETEFTADIAFRTDATLHYVSDYRSYLVLEKDASRNVSMDSMNGEGMCDLYELVITQYSGKINLSFVEPQMVDTIESIMQNIIKDDSPVSIVLDIDTACLIEINA